MKRKCLSSQSGLAAQALLSVVIFCSMGQCYKSASGKDSIDFHSPCKAVHSADITAAAENPAEPAFAGTPPANDIKIYTNKI